MKRVFFLSLVIAMFAPLSTQALTVETKDTITSDSTRIVPDTYLAAGGTLDLASTYENDVIVSGGTITISGLVKADVIVTGGTLKISGPVEGNIRAIGGTVEISSQVNRNLTLIGGDLMLTDTAVIKGEALVMGGTFTQSGAINGALSFRGGNVVLNGTVGGNVALQLGDACGGQTECLRLGSKAHVKGNLEYWSDKAATIPTGATIDGHTTHHALEQTIDMQAWKQIWTAFRVWKLFASLCFGILLALLFPKLLRNVVAHMTSRMGAAIGFGALVAFATPLVLLILMVTVIGIPIAIITGGWYFFLFMLSSVVVGGYIGDIVFRAWRKIPLTTPLSRSQLVATVTIGMVIMALVFDFLLPVSVGRGIFVVTLLGGIVKFYLTIWAFGALVMNAWETIRDQK